MEAAPDDDLLGFGQSHAFDEIDEKLPAGKGAVEKLLAPLHRPILNGDLWGLPDPSLFPPAQSNVEALKAYIRQKYAWLVHVHPVPSSAMTKICRATGFAPSSMTILFFLSDAPCKLVVYLDGHLVGTMARTADQ